MANDEVKSIIAGVTVSWLSTAFQMTRARVERRLQGVQPLGVNRYKAAVYDFKEAASYLISPRIDIQEFIDDMGPEALPEKLRDAYWSGMLKRQRYEEKAGELWRTEVVLARLSEVLQSMRSKLTLIPDRLERSSGLSEEQRRIATEIVEGVQDEIYQEIIKFSSSGETPNQLGELRRSETPPASRDNTDLI